MPAKRQPKAEVSSPSPTAASPRAKPPEQNLNEIAQKFADAVPPELLAKLEPGMAPAMRAVGFTEVFLAAYYRAAAEKLASHDPDKLLFDFLREMAKFYDPRMAEPADDEGPKPVGGFCLVSNVSRPRRYGEGDPPGASAHLSSKDSHDTRDHKSSGGK